MSSGEGIIAYARLYFSDVPKIDFAKIGEILGKANLDEMIKDVKDTIAERVNETNKLNEKVSKLSKTRPLVRLKIAEIKALISAKGVALENLKSVIVFLMKQKGLIKKQKFVLPDCRNVKHFKIGDDIMIYVGKSSSEHCVGGKVATHDWIPAKMLCAGWDWIMHCNSNEPWTGSGGNGGHYFRSTDQNLLFKRHEFYGLRKMLKENSDPKFLKLIPKHVRDWIANGTVYPMTDKELEIRQEDIIRLTYNATDFYEDSVITMAKERGIKLQSK